MKLIHQKSLPRNGVTAGSWISAELLVLGGLQAPVSNLMFWMAFVLMAITLINNTAVVDLIRTRQLRGLSPWATAKTPWGKNYAPLWYLMCLNTLIFALWLICCVVSPFGQHALQLPAVQGYFAAFAGHLAAFFAGFCYDRIQKS
jgi:hypothetical protein